MRKTECLTNVDIVGTLLSEIADDIQDLEADQQVLEAAHQRIRERFMTVEENFSGVKEYLNTLPVADLKQKRRIIEIDKIRQRLKEKLLS